MDANKLFDLMDLWFGPKTAQEAANKAWHAAWEAREAWGTREAREAWGVWKAAREAYRLAHMQASLAILYRNKWGQ